MTTTPVSPRRFAVLDLGSTTFQLLVADGTSDGWLVPILRDRVVLNLGFVLGDRGEIPPEVADRAGATARRLHDVAVRSGAERVVPIATSALRESPNRDELERLLETALGQPVRFIDGHEEARLTAAGVRASLALPPGPALLLDLGGGSLEVALTEPDGLRWGVSLPVGAGRLTGLLVRSDPPTRDERKAVRKTVEEAIASVADRVAGLGMSEAIASGGTAGALARLIAVERWTEIPPSLNQYAMGVDEVKAITGALADRTLAQRLKMPGIDERRAELLPAGGWILTTAAAALGVETFIHSEWGLREGVVLDELGLADRPALEPTALRERSVERLLGVVETPRHLDLVERIAVELFDALEPEHGLGTSDRELLAAAARLHEVGSAISPAKYHKHGAYLVEHWGLRGFTPEEIAVLSSMVRFHRGKDPRPVYAPFAGLEPERRDAVVLLTGILRVAHAIGRGDEPVDLAMDVRTRSRAIGILVRGSTNPRAVIEETTDAGALLGGVLGRAIEVEADDRHDRVPAAATGSGG